MPSIYVDGLPVAEPASTWFQCATLLAPRDLTALGDRLVTAQGRGRSVRPAQTTLEALAATISTSARARGTARARAALADVRIGPQSRMETLLRLLLVETGLPEPAIAPAIQTRSRVLHPDLAFLQWRVVLEYEGDGHRTDARQWRHDIWRREAFEEAGYRVIRVHSEDVLAEPAALVARVRRVVAQRQHLAR
jgi:very-short-patch-repair endonuclease